MPRKDLTWIIARAGEGLRGKNAGIRRLYGATTGQGLEEFNKGKNLAILGADKAKDDLDDGVEEALKLGTE